MGKRIAWKEHGRAMACMLDAGLAAGREPEPEGQHCASRDVQKIDESIPKLGMMAQSRSNESHLNREIEDRHDTISRWCSERHELGGAS